MAVVQSPLLSLSARGRVGDGPVYSSYLGRPVVKQYSVPSDPETNRQRSRRLLFSFLSDVWPSLSSDEKESWYALADRKRISAKNAFFSFNLKRWTRRLAPMARPTDNPAVYFGTWAYFSRTNGYDFSDIAIICSSCVGLWGLGVFSTPFYPTSLPLSEIVFLGPVSFIDGVFARFKPALPDTDFFSILPFMRNGTFAPILVDI